MATHSAIELGKIALEKEAASGRKRKRRRRRVRVPIRRPSIKIVEDKAKQGLIGSLMLRPLFWLTLLGLGGGIGYTLGRPEFWEKRKADQFSQMNPLEFALDWSLDRFENLRDKINERVDLNALRKFLAGLIAPKENNQPQGQNQ